MLEPSSVDCVIYHANCTDGFGSAFSAWKLLGNRAEYHSCTHGTKPPNVKGKNPARGNIFEEYQVKWTGALYADEMEKFLKQKSWKYPKAESLA